MRWSIKLVYFPMMSFVYAYKYHFFFGFSTIDTCDHCKQAMLIQVLIILLRDFLCLMCGSLFDNLKPYVANMLYRGGGQKRNVVLANNYTKSRELLGPRPARPARPANNDVIGHHPMAQCTNFHKER